jgi:hypothetical protein
VSIFNAVVGLNNDEFISYFGAKMEYQVSVWMDVQFAFAP